MKHQESRLSLLTIFCVAALVARAAVAQVTFVGSSGSLSASATFATSGNSLVVTLSNTSPADVLIQGHVLSSLFFNVDGSLLGLTPGTGSAVLAAGSSVLFGTTDPGNVVGGEWSYREGISGSAPLGLNYGISSAGFGIFNGANFPGTDLSPPPAVNGINYGITSMGDNPATGQSAVTGTRPLIQHAVVFTIPGLPNGFDPAASIHEVWWQYGTALSPTDIGFSVPEPSACVLFFAGVVSLIARRRR